MDTMLRSGRANPQYKSQSESQRLSLMDTQPKIRQGFGVILIAAVSVLMSKSGTTTTWTGRAAMYRARKLRSEKRGEERALDRIAFSKRGAAGLVQSLTVGLFAKCGAIWLQAATKANPMKFFLRLKYHKSSKDPKYP